MQASLPDCTMMPWISSLIGVLLLIGMNIADVPDGAPPVRQAFSLVWNSSSSLTLPSFRARNSDGERHELAHARGRHEIVGSLLKQHRSRLGVDQDRILGLGDELARALRKRMSCDHREEHEPRADASRPMSRD